MSASQQELHHIVIVGGGAGGLELATQLGRRLGKSKRAKITLIDMHLTHVWKPLWHEVAAGTLDSHEDELNYVAQAYENHFHFVLGEFHGLNRDAQEIYLAPVFDKNIQEIIPQRTIHYHTLVIAVGSISNNFNTPGANEHCLFLDSTLQAEQFQQHFLNKLIYLQTHGKISAEHQFSIAIVGGGATGVELAAELHYAVEQSVQYGLADFDPQRDIKITIIEAAERILAALPARLSFATTTQLQKMGIEIITGQRVNQVTADGFHTDSGILVPAVIKVWAAGIQAPVFLTQLDGLETNHLHQLVVTQTLQATRDENIFAFGDCAFCPQPGDKAVPPRAQAAHQQAKLLLKSLVRRVEGQPPLPYYYRDYGSLISLSRYSAIGNLMGRATGNLMIEGTIARFMYWSLYKVHQMALYGWWRVALLTLSNLLTRRIKPRLKLH